MTFSYTLKTCWYKQSNKIVFFFFCSILIGQFELERRDLKVRDVMVVGRQRLFFLVCVSCEECVFQV